ncbi:MULTISPECIES: NPCBM/NEW2 domain-containing protein [Deinococcus]|uniref:NPCBM/NEW2 domain-containing protein n=1 Tax=Deinococcus rufus TaxID=2136097 RepID=A0ABV7Z556_9DEIO|nr:NPCBM/NEW2 domain-containing protein [Deinococcus sp. AB2017081]WQE95064.1 NPCBM/NEW2 domain-containing protein [Deinococcus sp. AB2017081]
MHTSTRVLLPLCLATMTLLLGACGTSARTAPDPDAVADQPWVYTAPDTAFSAQSLTPGANSLSRERMLQASNGWGPIEIDRSNGEQRAGDGRTLTIAGQTFSRGFGVHANSSATFSLAGPGATCSRFRVGMGIDDEVKGRGSVTFQIYLDGTLAYSSGVMRGQGAGRLRWADLNITGKQQLKLVVTDGGDGRSSDHADWVMPQVFCQAAGPRPRVTFGQSSVEIFHKHHATVNATFTGISGAVTLRLVPPQDFPTGGYAPGGSRPVVLETTTVTLGGAARTVPLNLAAPGLPGYFNETDGTEGRLSYPYTLVASQDGRDVASATITINEKMLRLEPSVEYPDGPLRSGVPGTFVVTMKVTPALETVEELGLGLDSSGACQEPVQVTPVGSTYLENGLLKRRYQMTCSAEYTTSLNTHVGLGDISGYREWWYWTTFGSDITVTATP